MSIHLDCISKKFGSNVVLDSFTFSMKSGRITYLLGPNGCGKTTLVNIVLGLLNADAGSVKFDNLPLEQCRDKVSVVFDEPPVYPNYSGYDNLKLLSNVFSKQAWQNEVLLPLNLDKTLLKKKAKTLSLGQRHRLAVAAAFIRNPSYMLLDEPAIGLDSDSWEAVRNLLVQKTKEHEMTTVVTGHNYDLMENFVDDIIIFSKARIHFIGSIDELKSSSATAIKVRTQDARIEKYGFERIHESEYERSYLSEKDWEEELLSIQKSGILLERIETIRKNLREMYEEILRKEESDYDKKGIEKQS